MAARSPEKSNDMDCGVFEAEVYRHERRCQRTRRKWIALNSGKFGWLQLLWRAMLGLN
ncbi:MAG: hypothetical protein ACJAU6_001293 [Alphaproteobacteria bacterium]|jgi:hypothetical protein